MKFRHIQIRFSYNLDRIQIKIRQNLDEIRQIQYKFWRNSDEIQAEFSQNLDELFEILSDVLRRNKHQHEF